MIQVVKRIEQSRVNKQINVYSLLQLIIHDDEDPDDDDLSHHICPALTNSKLCDKSGYFGYYVTIAKCAGPS